MNHLPCGVTFVISHRSLRVTYSGLCIAVWQQLSALRCGAQVHKLRVYLKIQRCCIVACSLHVQEHMTILFVGHATIRPGPAGVSEDYGSISVVRRVGTPPSWN